MTIQRPRLALITTFGLGNLRPAPGTWGSLPPCAVAALLCILPNGSSFLPSGEHAWVFYTLMLLTLLLFSFACVAHADDAEMHFGKKDPSNVVADETAGMALTLCALPWFNSGAPTLALIALAFLLFRAADIIKPYPAHQLQSIPGGWGILIDDLVAALYAAAMLIAFTLPMKSA